MKLHRIAVYLAIFAFVIANLITLPVVARAGKPQPVSHLFQAKDKPRVTVPSIYDGPFVHGSPMLVEQEDALAVRDSLACLHVGAHAQVH